MSNSPQESTYRMVLAYDGTDYHGWQYQPGVATVSGRFAQALEAACGARPRIAAAGRTDAGVHAHGQVVSFRLAGAMDPQQLLHACNRHLPRDIAVRAADLAPQGFDPRRDAWRRTYRYLLSPNAVLEPAQARYVWRVSPTLELAPMRAAAARLIGTRDFGGFGRSPWPGGSTTRTVDMIEVLEADGLVRLDIRGDAFLRGMVRSLVGALVSFGVSRLRRADLGEALGRGSSGGKRWLTAPARGLHQWRVEYHRPAMVGVLA
ncbi:MAG: tRNA pseudouridine(38-40) synthase TruA [Candidatus Dormibacteria bacterium]